MKPVFHKDSASRAQARRIRDINWAFADLVEAHGVVWFCWWDKDRRHSVREDRAPNLFVTGLIDGVEMLDWLEKHPDWWIIGDWDDARYAAPVRLTDVGHAALQKREMFDMEPADWGLVEPGHRAIPAIKP